MPPNETLVFSLLLLEPVIWRSSSTLLECIGALGILGLDPRALDEGYRPDGGFRSIII